MHCMTTSALCQFIKIKIPANVILSEMLHIPPYVHE